MALKTVKPTGRTAWPRILLEGTEQSGKSWSVAELSASSKVGRTAVLVLGEDDSMWHEYGLIPGSRFQIATHDGTWASIIEAAKEARGEAQAAVAAGEPPYVFCVDTMTAVWEGLKNWASNRARNSIAGRQLLEADPDAKVEVAPNYWNDANDRHGQLLGILRTIPGIVILIARGGEVTLFENGQPAKGSKVTWGVQAQKTLPFSVTAHVRLSNEARPLLISSKGVNNPIRPGIDPPRRLPDDWTLESVIFGTLGLNPAKAAVGGFTEMRPDLTPMQIRDEAVDLWTSVARVRELYEIARNARFAMSLANEHGEDEQLSAMLARIGASRAKFRKGLKEDDPWLDAIVAMATPEDAAKIRSEIETSFASLPAGDARLIGIREAWAQRAREIAEGAGAEAENAWVAEFMDRLAESADTDALTDEVNRALAAGVIGARVCSELLQVVADKARAAKAAA